MRVTEDDAIRVCECMGYKLTPKNITMIHTALQCYFVIANTSPRNPRKRSAQNLNNSGTNNLNNDMMGGRSNTKPKLSRYNRKPKLTPERYSVQNFNNSGTNRFKLHNTLGDGDCLFHAFINAFKTTIGGTAPVHNNRNVAMAMRRDIFEKVARNNKNFNLSIIGSNAKEEMMARVLTCGEYGGQEEIVVLSQMYKVNIAVIHEKHLKRKSKPYTEDELQQLLDKNNTRMIGYMGGYPNTVYLGYRGDLKSNNGGHSAHFTAIIKV